jgi:ATP-dependent Clp protease ATP-binding subunit ClpB
MSKIVDIQLNLLADHLAENKDIHISFSDKLRNALAEAGYDPTYGARPLRRLIQTQILNTIATKIVEGSLKEGQSIRIDETILNI